MVVALAASFALWAWFTPALLNRGATVEVLDGSRFTFGPYPEQAQLEELAEAGYTHIISLLHPGVVPFEPILLSRERDNVARAGLEFVHAPMLPWVGNNEASLALIQELVEGDSGRYYVHCYLGRDRVGVVRRLVSGLSAIVMETSGDLHPLAQLDHFERGGVERIGDNLFLTPFPTDEEMLAFFLNEQTAQVVSLLDPEVEANRSFMEHEREQLALVGVPLVELPLTQQATAGELLSAAEAIGRLEGVTILHRFRSDDPVSRALAQLLKGNR